MPAQGGVEVGQHALRIFHYLMVGEADHAITLLLKEGRAARVILDLPAMCIPVQFDREPGAPAARSMMKTF